MKNVNVEDVGDIEGWCEGDIDRLGGDSANLQVGTKERKVSLRSSSMARVVCLDRIVYCEGGFLRQTRGRSRSVTEE